MAWKNPIEKSLFELPIYNSTHQTRGDRKAGGVSIYIHKSLDFTVKSDPSINNNNIGALNIEIVQDKTRNTFINALYRPHLTIK